jgi:hypothetical protein
MDRRSGMYDYAKALTFPVLLFCMKDSCALLRLRLACILQRCNASHITQLAFLDMDIFGLFDTTKLDATSKEAGLLPRPTYIGIE